jgi:Tfp pilus assembly protein PilN
LSIVNDGRKAQLLFQTSIGIDVQHDRFNVVALKTRLNRVLPAAHTTFAFDGALSPEDKVKVIADVVGQFIRQHRIMATDFFVGIPREQVILREIQLPLSVKENLRTSLTYEMPKYIPASVGDIYFDYQVIEEKRQENQLRLLLFAARRRDVDLYLNLAAHLGQKLSGIEIPSTALAAFLALHPPGKAGPRYGMIRAENKGGEICLYDNGALALSQWIDSAGGDGDLAGRLLAAAQVIHGRQAEQMPWLYCGKENGGALPAPLAAAALNISAVDTVPADLPGAEWAPAFGLAARGLRAFGNSINLLPPALRKKPNRRAYYLMLALIGVVLLTTVAWGASHLIRHRMAIAQIQSELQHLRPQAIEVEALLSANNQMEAQLAQLGALRKARVSTLLALEDLSTRIPPTAWVEHLALQTDSLRITGFADSASELLTLLEASPLFKDVVFLSAITRTKDGKERFLIGMGFE